MSICPHCLKPLSEPFPLQPGDFLVCLACGEILRLNDQFAITPAQPEEFIRVTKTRFRVLLKQRCRVIRQKLSAGITPLN